MRSSAAPWTLNVINDHDEKLHLNYLVPSTSYLSLFLLDFTSALRSLSPMTTAAFLACLKWNRKELESDFNSCNLINKEDLILDLFFCWHSLISGLYLLFQMLIYFVFSSLVWRIKSLFLWWSYFEPCTRKRFIFINLKLSWYDVWIKGFASI